MKTRKLLNENRKTGVVKALVISAVVSLGGLASGATNIWLGPVSSDWNEPGNWSLNAVPEATDIVEFPVAANITMPMSYAGVMKIADTVAVEATITGTTEFSLKVPRGATFTKKGPGDLTLKAYPGAHQGAVTLAEGKTYLKGNGIDAAGAFGVMTVKTGATVEVIDSPAATRHGGVYLCGVPDGTYFYEDERTDSYGESMYSLTYQKLLERWEGLRYIDQNYPVNRGITVPGEGQVFFGQGTQGPLDAFNPGKANAEYAMISIRALMLAERETTVEIYEEKRSFKTFSNFASSFNLAVDDTREFCKSGWGDFGPTGSWSGSAALTRGWHEFYMSGRPDLSGFWTTDTIKYGYYTADFKARAFLPYSKDGGYLTADRLWHGVCAASLIVEEGATFKIADEQAFAVGAFEACSIATGSLVSGGKGAYFTIAGGQGDGTSDAFPLSAMRDFDGLIELGATAVVQADDAVKAAGYSIVGRGEVRYADGAETRLASDFKGRVMIPSGKTVAADGFPSGVTLFGAGSVTGMDAKSSGLTEKILDGKTKAFSSDNLPKGETVTLPNYDDLSTWGLYKGSETMRVPVKADSPWVIPNNCPRVDSNGRLVMNDATHYQFTSAYLTNIVIHMEDEFEISFKCRHWTNPKYSPETWDGAAEHGVASGGLSGYFFFGFKPESGTDYIKPGDWGKTVMPAHFCGFGYGGWKDPSAKRAALVLWNGDRQGSPFREADFADNDYTKETTVTIRGANGIAHVSFEQAGGSSAFDLDLTPAFLDDLGVHFGFLGQGDGNAADSHKLWAYQEVWNFKGWIHRGKFPNGEQVNALAWGDNGKWKVSPGQSLRTDLVPAFPGKWIDGQTLQLVNRSATETADTREYVVGKTGVKVGTPFRFSFDYCGTIDQYNLNYDRDQRFAFYVQTEGESPMMTGLSNGGTCVLPNATPVFGCYFGSYGADPCPRLTWCCTDGTAASIDAVRDSAPCFWLYANQTNHIEMTYDGNKTFTVMVMFPSSTGKAPALTQQVYDNIATSEFAGKTLYPMICSCEQFGCGNIFISNVKFETFSRPEPAEYGDPVEVAEDAQATIEVTPLTLTSAYDLLFKNLRLGAGSTLNVTPAGCTVGFSPLTVSGAATVNAGSATVKIGDISLKTDDARLSVVGTAEVLAPVTITIPAKYLKFKGDKTVLDFSGATMTTGLTPSDFTFVSEDGAALKMRNVCVEWVDRRLRLRKSGVAMVIR